MPSTIEAAVKASTNRNVVGRRNGNINVVTDTRESPRLKRAAGTNAPTSSSKRYRLTLGLKYFLRGGSSSSSNDGAGAFSRL